MKFSRIVSALAALLFGAVGLALALFTVKLSFASLDAEPVLLRPSQSVSECAEGLLDAICSGDYRTAGSYLSGNPRLETAETWESESAELIWNAFLESMEYELVGESYADNASIAQDVTIRYLDFSSVTRNLKERSEALMKERVAQSEDMSAIYDENNNYREDFALAALRDATREALAEDAEYTQQELTLHLVFDQDRWKVLPDQALLNAISGGIIG